MLAWKDGQPFSEHFGDIFYSADSGLEEKRHVFLRGNDLPKRFTALAAGDSFCVGETGFGTALNFLCTWQLFEDTAPVGASLDFFSVEKFPLDEGGLRGALDLWPELRELTESPLVCWRRRVPGWNRWSFAGGRIRLTLVIGDVAQALSELPAASVDAWFLDGFSPAKNPDMWSDGVMLGVARASRTTATLSTYTSAGWVRRGLQQAGFEVERIQGFGSKHEMLRGVLVCAEDSPALSPYPDEGGRLSPSPAGGRVGMGEHPPQSATRHRTPRNAIIIGGGIAGCAAAHALAQRGIRVTLIDRAPQLAAGASGNPRGILHARFGASDNPAYQFVLAAYGHALSLFDAVLPVDGVSRAECGLLQLACNAVEKKRLSRLAESSWPEHLMQFVDAEQAGELAGVAMQFGGVWFPAGGWVVPPAVCAALVSDERITQLLGHRVETFEQTGTAWQLQGHDSNGNPWTETSELLVLCCAHSAKQFEQFMHFPLTPVRGQISLVPQTPASLALQAVVCGDGYCAPAVQGIHVVGATHTFEDESTEVRDTDHAENLAKLAAYAPALHQALTLKNLLDRHSREGGNPANYTDSPSGRNANSDALCADYLNNWIPACAGMTKPGASGLFGLVGRASVRCSAPGSMPMVGKVQENLYCSLAHGTRGLLSAGLAAEVLATQICNQLPPLPVSMLDALSPLPRIRKQGKSAP